MLQLAQSLGLDTTDLEAFAIEFRKGEDPILRALYVRPDAAGQLERDLRLFTLIEDLAHIEVPKTAAKEP